MVPSDLRNADRTLICDQTHAVCIHIYIINIIQHPFTATPGAPQTSGNTNTDVVDIGTKGSHKGTTRLRRTPALTLDHRRGTGRVTVHTPTLQDSDRSIDLCRSVIVM